MTHKNTADREQYKCRFCEKMYALPRTRDKHEFTHFGFTNLKCSKCKSRFSSLKSLEAHIDIYHGGSGEAEGSISNYDGTDVSIQGDYEETQDGLASVAWSPQDGASVGGSHMGVDEFPDSASVVASEVVTHSAIGNYYKTEGDPNAYTKQVFSSSVGLNNGNAGKYANYANSVASVSSSSHSTTTSNHKQRNHVCPICNQRFFFLLHLKEHIESHQVPGSDTFKCNNCNQRFTNAEMFRKHLDSHPREVRCDMCDDSFHFQSELEEHKLKTHQTPASKKMMCHICNSQRFRTATQLEYHILANHKLGSLDCPSCGLQCRNTEHYKSHYMFCHIKSKAFHCKMPGCNKSYACEGHLNRHLVSKHGYKK